MDKDFIAAMLADPEASTPRLIYADWLEEQGKSDHAEFVRAQCELTLPVLHRPSGHSVHHVSRTVDVEGNPAWSFILILRGEEAELLWGSHFIAIALYGAEVVLQCVKVHKTGQGKECVVETLCDKVAMPAASISPERLLSLLERERELWPTVRETFRSLLPAASPHGWYIRLGSEPRDEDGTRPVAIVRRGFVTEVHCTVADWCGRTCGKCRSGFVRAMDDSALLLRCRDCDGKGWLPGHGPLIVTQQPVEVVCVTDVEIVELRSRDGFSFRLPEDYHPQQWPDYEDEPLILDTREEAERRLSSDALAWARREQVALAKRKKKLRRVTE